MYDIKVNSDFFFFNLYKNLLLFQCKNKINEMKLKNTIFIIYISISYAVAMEEVIDWLL